MHAFLPARVVKLVDTGDSKSPAERCVGSSPTPGTKCKKNSLRGLFFYVRPFAGTPPSPFGGGGVLRVCGMDVFGFVETAFSDGSNGCAPY